MFGLNELFLPLLGGYIFVTRWYVTRYLARQWSGYRLFFNSAIAGAIFLALSILLVSLLKQFSPVAQQWLSLLFPAVYPYLDASVFAFIVGGVLWVPFNFVQRDKEALAIRYAEEFGGPLQVLLAKAFSETRQVAITLSSGKVYIGFVTKLNESQNQEEFVLIWPQFSGYRESETKQFRVTTDYAPVYEQIAENPEQFAGISIDDFQVVLPTADLESVSIFDFKVFELFANAEAVFNSGDELIDA
ncbi:hypothetical protein [Almyronema epifaneia]|uniref:Uncharacterized protein n=1 Tax=Almyronema epifaneia S1 TaxID=2991925 RepID=A0ABW6IEX7_9CYAN